MHMRPLAIPATAGAPVGEAPLTPEVLDNLRKTPFFLAMQP